MAETMVSGLWALAALIGGITALISAVQGFRALSAEGDQGDQEAGDGTPPKPPPGQTDKLLDRLSLIPRGAFRGKNGA